MRDIQMLGDCAVMRTVYLFVGKYFPEVAAIAVSGVALSIGLVSGWDNDPENFNRAGSILIVVGVVLAVSRYSEWMLGKTKIDIEKNRLVFIESLLSKIEDRTGRPLSDGERVSARLNLNRQIDKGEIFDEFSTNYLESSRSRLRSWEVWLVVLGTLVSGFGDLFVHWLKNFT